MVGQFFILEMLQDPGPSCSVVEKKSCGHSKGLVLSVRGDLDSIIWRLGADSIMPLIF